MSKAYEQSGVDIHAGYEAVERMSSHVKRTMRKEVIGGLGGFGATFDLSQLNMKAPVLVSSQASLIPLTICSMISGITLCVAI